MSHEPKKEEKHIYECEFNCKEYCGCPCHKEDCDVHTGRYIRNIKEGGIIKMCGECSQKGSPSSTEKECTLATAVRDICSVSVTAAPKSKVRDILEKLISSERNRLAEEIKSKLYNDDPIVKEILSIIKGNNE